MVDDSSSETNLLTAQALPQMDRATNLECSRDVRASMVAQLKRIGLVVSAANQEQAQQEANQFTTQANRLIALGNAYIGWLEKNQDTIIDSSIFQAVASLAKTSLFLNLEQYVLTIRDIAEYVSSQPDLLALNPPGSPDSPWSGIKETLYYSRFNDARETYREGILHRGTQLIATKELDPRQLDHIERFLVDPQGRPPHRFIPEYIASHASELQKWVSLSLDDFRIFIIQQLGTEDHLSQNSFLKQLDEEIASIKPESLQKVEATKKTKYTERQKKLAFIRDLRFGRIILEDLKRDVKILQEEITRQPDLAKVLAPRLRDHWQSFRQNLVSTAGTEAVLRKQTLLTLARSYDLPSQELSVITDYLERHIR